MDFADPADHTVNVKENEKNNKCLDLARGLKKMWNMKETVIPILIGAFRTIPIGFCSQVLVLLSS